MQLLQEDCILNWGQKQRFTRFTLIKGGDWEVNFKTEVDKIEF